MKKIIPLIAIILVAAIAVFGFIYYNNNFANNDNNQGSSSKNVPATGKDKNEEKELAKKVNSKGKDTLLIYMVGSDLESRSGAGTDDLREIEESGIDLKKANVLVYAGGSQKWHNDNMYEGKNTVLQLGKKGFEPVAKMESSNMGDSSSLLEFLNYSCENYPSDSYSLIMWDHGNGPIIGYGKDMLFDNDSLTLLEMDKALKASPFGNGKKLEWVGFDACLMSSAELVCIWDNYAKYLIASQEVEPSFGWNYGFLKDFAKVDTTTLAKNIVDQYIGACTAYYQKRGYDDRDTTLACMNLAYASELESAINGLFAKADEDVYTQYNTLVSKRVDTRALGRASTGSEYDLIDLNDMAEQLSEVYPDETKKISDVIKKIVIKNGTNTQGCCGLSLYYPFYNKYYYEDSWGDAYGNIGLFSNYKSYLNKYQEIWLKDDKLDKYASSNTPVEEDTRSGFEFDKPQNSAVKKYKLQLTKAQDENYAEAKIYILAKRGKDKYHVVFSDNNVINDNGVLTFDFEGKGIYIKNKFSEYYLPVSTGYDTVGDTNRYALKIRGKKIEGQELQDALFNISLNKKTGEVHLSSINPDSKPTTRNIIGGKLEELDINNWDYIFPMRPDYIYLQRYNNGVVKPLNEWIGDRVVSWQNFCVRDEIEFVYSALDDGEYSLIFEITDTQNNKYCSEPIEINVESDEKEIYQPKDINVEWIEGDRVRIFESDGAVLYLKKKVEYGKPYYVLEAENKNEYAISYTFNDVIINGNIAHGYASLHAKPNQTATGFSGISFDELTDIGVIDDIHCISGILTAEITPATNTVDKIKTIEKNQNIRINISGNAQERNLKERFPKYDFIQHFYGASSEQQEIYNNDKIKITLQAFGKAEGLSLPGYFQVENLTEEEQVYTIDAYSINGYTYDSGGGGVLAPKCIRNHMIYLSSGDMKKNNISSIKTFEMKISLYQDREQIYNDVVDKSLWLKLQLNLCDDMEYVETEEYGETIFNENDVKITIIKYGIYRDGPQWKINIENNSDEDISVRFGDDGNVTSTYLASGLNQVAAHNKITDTISTYTHKEVPQEIFARVYIMDYSGTEILYKSDKMLKFNIEPLQVPSAPICVDWSKDGEMLLDTRNGVSLIIKKLDWYGQLCYALEIQNSTDEYVSYDVKDIIVNGNILLDDIETLWANANENRVGPKVPYYTAATDFGVIDEVNSISFKIKETSSFILPTALNDQEFIVAISGDATINDFNKIYKPIDLSELYLDAKASKQEIFNNGNLKVDFLGLGGIYHPEIKAEGYYSSAYTSGNYGFCIENTSTKYQTINIEGLSVNGAYVPCNKNINIPPGCKTYISNYIGEYDLLPYGITSIAELSVALSTYDDSFIGNAQLLWLPIKLDTIGKPVSVTEITTPVIYDKSGIKVAIDSYEVDKWGSSIYTLLIVNTSSSDISLNVLNEDGTPVKSSVSNVKLGPKQYRKVKIEFYEKVIDEFEVSIVVKDLSGENIISKSDALIKINNKVYISKGE